MINRIISSEFFRASFWVFLATGVMNVGSYFYHLIMGRLLGPENYGVLYSSISLLYDLSIITLPFSFVVIKFISSYKGRGEKEKIASFYVFLKNKLAFYGFLASFVLVILSPYITSFLHLPNIWFAILAIGSFYIGLFPLLVKNTLQGLLKFFPLFIMSVFEVSTKLLVALFFVYLGFQALGAFIGIFASVLITFFLGFYLIQKEKLHSAIKFEEEKQVFKYSIPVFLTTIGLTSLFTTDVLLVRNFFPGIESGYYSALSVLSKIIYFGTLPIIMVLFPFVSERNAKRAAFKHLVFVGLSLAVLISLLVILIYYFFPNLMIEILFGKGYLAVAPLLWVFGVFIAIYSLSALLANFYLSIHRDLPSFLVTAAGILQIILIGAFHKDLLQIIAMSIIATSTLLLALIFYYPFAIKKENR